MNPYSSYNGIAPGKVIKRELDKRKISQRDFSDQINMHFQTLNNVIKGHRKLTLPQAIRIEEALGLDEGFLMVLQLYTDIENYKNAGANTTVEIPKIRKVVFWDTDIDKLDWTKHKDFIIKRVMDRGNTEEKQAIATYYKLELDTDL